MGADPNTSTQIEQGGTPADARDSLPRIAVVAVHGVADQAPCESARQIAALLLRTTHSESPGGRPRYSSFREYPLLLPISAATANKTCDTLDPDVAFTAQLLGGHEAAPDDSHGTLRLEGHRLNDSGRDEAELHVYEFYWADLSRLSARLGAILNGAVQLISSLAWLGRDALARVLTPTATATRLHTAAVSLLTIVVPWANLALLAVAMAVPVTAAPRWVQVLIIAAVSGGLLALVLHVGWRRQSARPDARRAPMVAIVCYIGAVPAALVIAHVVDSQQPITVSRLLLASILLVVGAVGLALATLHERRRPGARMVASAVGLLVLATYVHAGLVLDRGRPELVNALLSGFESLFWVMQASWVLLFISAAAALVCSLVATRASRDKNAPETRQSDARLAVYTAAGTFAASLCTVSVVIVTLWAGVTAITTRSIPVMHVGEAPLAGLAVQAGASTPVETDSTLDGSYPYVPLGRYVTSARDDTNHVSINARASSTSSDTTFARSDRICFDTSALNDSGYRVCHVFSQRSLPHYMMASSAAFGLLIPLGFLALMVTLSIVALTPSVVSELRPSRVGSDRRSFERSAWTGLWLTSGLRVLRKAALWGSTALLLISIVAMGLALLRLVFVESMALPSWPIDELRRLSDSVTSSIGSVVTASALTIALLVSRLEGFAKTVRPALDVMLDVDNYLRQLPKDGTPRALMFGRLVSLMRYLACWKRGTKGYDAIVFVAHSQGSMIVLETLRFHRAVGFAELGGSDLPCIHLMTMGCPLRQLYSRAFPSLYDWTRLAVEMAPEKIGLERWVNLYRSGDYVGRALIRPSDSPNTFGKEPLTCGKFEERCLGEGAHVHYWDRNARDVAKELNVMLDKALRA